MGVREIDRFLEQWQMDARDLHRRLILAPPPRERALRQAQEMARHLAAGPRMDGLGYGAGLGTGSDTIGRWAAAFGEGGPAALICEHSGGSPRPWQDATKGVKGSGARVACHGRHRTGQLELEGDSSVCLGAIRHQPEPQRLPELPPSTRGQALHRLGFAFKRPKKQLLKANEAKRRPSRRNTPPCGTRRGALAARYSSLTRPISGLTRSCGASGC